jgi:hypothetical protein
MLALIFDRLSTQKTRKKNSNIMKLRGMEVMTVAHEIGLTKIKVQDFQIHIVACVHNRLFNTNFEINLNKDPIE